MFAFISLLSSSAHAQVTANILTRVFPIRVGEQTGTSFTLEVDGRQYLITARHIVAGVSDGDSVQLLRKNVWTAFRVKRRPVEPFEADVAVLSLPSTLEQMLQIKATFEGVTIAEELYFLGFPYGLTLPGVLQQSGFPFPFVKHGICSAAGNMNKVTYVFLDGHNNPGFSGGPIVRQPPGGATPTIVGVVSGLGETNEPVYKQGEKTADLTHKANTGIIVGVAITHALQAIAARPIGAPLTPTPNP